MVTRPLQRRLGHVPWVVLIALLVFAIEVAALLRLPASEQHGLLAALRSLLPSMPLL